MNDYDRIAARYSLTNSKPDKQYSILATVLLHAGDMRGKTAADLGCGDGFFIKKLYKLSPLKAIGIDNSKEQLRRAKESSPPDIEYRLIDIFSEPLPKVDIFVLPFVTNYSNNIGELQLLMGSVYASLNNSGKVIVVIDLPNGMHHAKFGAVKTIIGPAEDGAEMKIELYNNSHLINLYARYYRKETYDYVLKACGFKNISWHKPIISPEGIQKFGKDFWGTYCDDAELGYVTAVK